MFEDRIVLTMFSISNTWLVNSRERKRVEKFDMKCLSRALGVTVMDMVKNQCTRENVKAEGVCKNERTSEVVWAHGEDRERKIHQKNIQNGGG